MQAGIGGFKRLLLEQNGLGHQIGRIRLLVDGRCNQGFRLGITRRGAGGADTVKERGKKLFFVCVHGFDLLSSLYRKECRDKPWRLCDMFVRLARHDVPLKALIRTVMQETFYREGRRKARLMVLKRFHARTRQPVDFFIFQMAGMAFYPVEGDVVALHGFI